MANNVEANTEQGQGQVRVRDWFEFPNLAELEFDKKVQEYRKYHDMEGMAKQRKDELKVEIEAALLVAGEKKLNVGDLVAIQCNGRTASAIDARELMMAGVDADIIAACTKKGKEYTYVQVQQRKKE